jgi:hypothetical protein
VLLNGRSIALGYEAEFDRAKTRAWPLRGLRIIKKKLLHIPGLLGILSEVFLTADADYPRHRLFDRLSTRSV